MSDHYNVIGAWPHNVGYPPPGDPLVFTLASVLFPVAATDMHINFRDEHIRNIIKGIQAVYIDNDSDARLTMRVANGPSYRIIAKPRSQGWYPLLISDENGIKVQASAIVVDPLAINLAFANVNLFGSPYATQ